MKLRVVITFATLSAMVGCSVSPQQGQWASSEPDAQMAPPARALAYLPPQAGQVISVLEQRRANGIVQDIVLSGEASVYGENKITVNAISGLDIQQKYAVPNQLDVTAAREEDIALELEEKFSGIKMGVGDTLERNAYGPFGYAVGKNGKVGCMYAWQTLGRSEPKKLFESSSGNQPASIRVKICRSGANPMALVSLMRQLSIGGVGPMGMPATAYGNAPMFNQPQYGAATYAPSDALAASGLGGYGMPGAPAGYGAPVYAATPTYNPAFGAPAYGLYPGMAQGGVMYNGYPASAYGGQYAQAEEPVVKPRVRKVRLAVRKAPRRVYAARPRQDAPSAPSLNIPMPDGSSQSNGPVPSAAVYRPRAAPQGSGGMIPMPE